MKNKGIIVLSIVAGLLVTALIIGLSFSGPENNGAGNSAVSSDDISTDSALAKEKDVPGVYMLDGDGTYYRIEQNDITIKEENLKPAGVWEAEGDTISLYAGE